MNDFVTHDFLPSVALAKDGVFPIPFPRISSISRLTPFPFHLTPSKLISTTIFRSGLSSLRRASARTLPFSPFLRSFVFLRGNNLFPFHKAPLDNP